MRRTSAVWWWLTAAALLLLTLCGAPAAGDGETQAPTTVLPRGDPHMVVCEDVRVRCAFNKGCSLALHNYFTKCDKSLVADPTKCPEMCMEALVTLTSTEDGKWLLDCTCRDHFCSDMKRRVEVCRPMVTEASRNDSIVSCELAQWICAVDQVCSSAMGYYHTYCKRMIQGDTCTERCVNSLQILQRQEKAAKLTRCKCAGPERHECLRNKMRMARLCWGVAEPGAAVGGRSESNGKPEGRGGAEKPEGGGNKSEAGGKPGGGGGRKNRKKHRPKSYYEDPDRPLIEFMLMKAEHLPNRRPDDVILQLFTNTTNAAKGRAAAVPAPPLWALGAAVLLLLVTLQFDGDGGR